MGNGYEKVGNPWVTLLTDSHRGHKTKSTISNDLDSGIEGMDVDELGSIAIGEKATTEKRKRTSSR